MLSTLFIYVSYMFWTIIKVLLFIYFFCAFPAIRLSAGTWACSSFSQSWVENTCKYAWKWGVYDSSNILKFQTKRKHPPPPLFNLFSPSFFFHHWAHIFFSPSNALHFFHVLILLVTQSLCCTCYVSPLLKCPSDSSDPILVMHINLFSPILPAPFHLYCLLNNHVWMV